MKRVDTLAMIRVYWYHDVVDEVIALARGKKEGTVTSTDVARLAGVSPASVTRVFNPDWTMNIRPDIREKVIAAAKELNYTPNAFARILAGNKTNLIAIVLGQTTGPYYSQFLLRFIYQLQRLGKQVLPFTIDEKGDCRALVEKIRPFRVDAIVLTSAAYNVNYEPLASDTPIILLELSINGSGNHSVSSDTYNGGRMVAEMLVENGHKRIAMISGNALANQDYDREYGFVNGLHDYGLKLWRKEDASYARYGTGCKAARRLLSGNERPDAIFCADDVIAMATIDVLRYEYSISVPDEISVVGFHNVQQASLPPYALTTMESPINRMVDAVVDIILHLDEHKEPVTTVFKMSPIIRNSMRITNEKYMRMREKWIASSKDEVVLNIFQC